MCSEDSINSVSVSGFIRSTQCNWQASLGYLRTQALAARSFIFAIRSLATVSAMRTLLDLQTMYNEYIRLRDFIIIKACLLQNEWD
jgi:hypothetical protein